MNLLVTRLGQRGKTGEVNIEPSEMSRQIITLVEEDKND